MRASSHRDLGRLPLIVLMVGLWFGELFGQEKSAPVRNHASRLLCFGTADPVLLRVEFDGAADGRKKYFRTLFEWLDRDNNGKLSPAEAGSIPVSGRISQPRPRWNESPDAAARFAAADANHDGDLSPIEFERLLDSQWKPWRLTVRAPNLAQSAPLLEQLDLDHDGRLTLDEIGRASCRERV